MNRTKLGIWTIFIVVVLVLLAKFSGISASKTYRFDFTDGISLEATDEGIQTLVKRNLAGVEGKFAVVIENMVGGEKYSLAASEKFPAASLYKLVLLAAVLKEIEEGKLSGGDVITSTKTHLIEVLGSVDFGYDEASEEIEYTIEEALIRVGRISDNFAAIMLSERLQRVAPGDPLGQMARELGLKSTQFYPTTDDPPTTTASDIALFFKKLYRGEMVSRTVSDKIIELLTLSKISDRIPAKLPEDVRVVHKTAELPRVRHDAGIVYLEEKVKNGSESAVLRKDYLIVMLSKELKFEDEGVEVLAQLSKDVYEYFKGK